MSQQSLAGGHRSQWAKKPVSPKEYYKNGPPDNIVLPFDDNPELTRPIVWTHTGVPGKMKTATAGVRKVIIPGWLTQLDAVTLGHLNEVKSIVASFRTVKASFSVVVTVLTQLINSELGLTSVVSEEEVAQSFERSPVTSGGVSFTHFMFTLASPDQDFVKAPIPPNHGNRTIASQDGYSDREKVFFSGILMLQMYDLVQACKELFHGYVPVHDFDLRRERESKGHGSATIGCRDTRKAEWDHSYTSAPVNNMKNSPYLHPVNFVSSRLVANVKSCLQRDGHPLPLCLNKFRHDHFIMTPPKGGQGNIVLQENRSRIAKALRYLFLTKNDCVYLLPDIKYLLHFSKPLSQSLEGIARPTPKKKKPIVNFVRDMIKIREELFRIFRPVQLPKEFHLKKHLITVSMAHEIRIFLSRMHEVHWQKLINDRIEVLNKVWRDMEIAHIPNVTVQNALFLSFTSLLPYIPHLTSPRNHLTFKRRPHQRIYAINYL